VTLVTGGNKVFILRREIQYKKHDTYSKMVEICYVAALQEKNSADFNFIVVCSVLNLYI